MATSTSEDRIAEKWTEAYSSLIISEALIVIINLISTMIYDWGPP